MIDLERLRRRDSQYLGELVKTHGPVVFRVCQGFGRDPDHAEDLYQEAWKRVFEKRKSYSGRGSFEGWLHRIATNLCTSDYRARKARREVHLHAALEAGDQRQDWWKPEELSEDDRQDFHDGLHRALAQLTDREHEAILLRRFEGKTTTEVAKTMGIKESSVRSTVRHAMKRLQELMKGMDDEMS